jgi:CheY-like chemotaxis protein
MALVLVIDDEEDARRVVELMLKNAGHDAVLAVEGNDALRQFPRQHNELVLLVKEFNGALEAFVRVIEIAVGQNHAPALAITNSASIWKRSSS